MIEFGGLQFEPAPDGGATVRIKYMATENSEVIRVVSLAATDLENLFTELGYDQVDATAVAPKTDVVAEPIVPPVEPPVNPEGGSNKTLSDQASTIIGE